MSFEHIPFNLGHTGPAVFWQSGRMMIYRHCDTVFTLYCDGVQVMPNGTFEKINSYLWSEFEVPGFRNIELA